MSYELTPDGRMFISVPGDRGSAYEMFSYPAGSKSTRWVFSQSTRPTPIRKQLE